MGSISCCSFPVLIFDSISIKDGTSDGQGGTGKNNDRASGRVNFLCLSCFIV